MGDYVVQPGDVIRIQVFQEPDLDRELPVSNGGLITGVPLLGAVPVKGLTVAQVEADIARRYNADYLVDPQITITVLRYAEQRVKVLGAVNGPGLVLAPPAERLTLIDAIARAGDFNRLADRRHIRVTRTNADGETANFVVDFDALRAGEASAIVWLERDDIIFVPERRL
jgi:polysaccharide biosynthesis/export protein